MYAAVGDARGVFPSSAFAPGDIAQSDPHVVATFTAHAVATSFFPNWQQTAAFPVQFDALVRTHLTDPKFSIFPRITLANNQLTIQASQRVAAVVAQAVILARVNDGAQMLAVLSLSSKIRSVHLSALLVLFSLLLAK